MFEHARLKLTAWYLSIIMLVSILFSVSIYTSINSELYRFERMQLRIQEDMDEGKLPPPPVRFQRTFRADPAVIKASRMRLLTTLAMINVAIFGFAGAAGYFLAGRTLTPIKRIVDEQKRFITDSSHELRTPLTALRTEIEVALRNKRLLPHDAKKLLESNLEEVLNLQHLSDNLLELAQNGNSIDKKDMNRVSLLMVIKSALKKVESLSSEKDIITKSNIHDYFILGIEDRLTECFVILLDNAIKYSPKNSTITIKTQKINKDMVQVLIADTGIGISKEDLSKIFDRFYRADSSRSKSAGYGLGLAIAKDIIKAHDASISAESAEGKGTTFKLLFRYDS